MYNRGFTLLELLIVIAIIGILSTVVLSNMSAAKEKAFYTRALSEFRSLETAIQMYMSDHDDEYPEDVTRGIPPGLGEYLAGQKVNTWPKAPWPDSIYDWDNWDDPDNPGEKIYQISIRFCPADGDISTCRFPDESWAKNFGVDSSVYYCLEGKCRAHSNKPINYPGYCVNCANH